MARESKEPKYLPRAHLILVHTTLWQGRLRQAAEHAQQCCETNDPDTRWEQTVLYGVDHVTSGQALGSIALTLLGSVEKGKAQAEEAYRAAIRYGHPMNYANVLFFRAVVHQIVKEYDEVRECVRFLRERGDEYGRPMSATGIALEGWARCAEGGREAGIRQLMETIDEVSRFSQFWVVYLQFLLVDAYVTCGQFIEAEKEFGGTWAAVKKRERCGWNRSSCARKETSKARDRRKKQNAPIGRPSMLLVCKTREPGRPGPSSALLDA